MDDKIFDQANIDSEAVDLLEETLNSQITSYLVSFQNQLPVFQEEEQRLEVLRKQFVSDYKIQRIMHMTKEEYVVGLGTKDTFCYRLETEFQDLGNIHGSNASKFGLYYGISGNDTERKYRFTKNFGQDPDQALLNIKDQIIRLYNAGERKDYEAISESKFASMVRGKILSTFFPEDYLGIFSEEHLDYFLSRLGMDIPSSQDILYKQEKLMEWKRNQPQLRNLSNFLFLKFLYSSFGRPFEEEKEHRFDQKIRDEKYPKEYASDIHITTDQWVGLLQDSTIFTEKDLDLIARIYVCDNHATTCYDLALQDGVSPSSYIKPVVALARRVSESMSLPPIYRKDGRRVWWRILFWGQRRKDSHFEWKLQPKLARAFQSVHPDLDDIEINEREDQILIDDLKQTVFPADNTKFEYSDQPKKKAVPIYTNGHKTYPRDRQTAKNALALADYCCEIDCDHPTFIRKNSDKRYTEPHHLIPMAFSEKFKVSLDVEQNIVSLCSNCHNQIHYGKDADILIKQLYCARRELLEDIGIHVKLNDLLKMYQINDEQ